MRGTFFPLVIQLSSGAIMLAITHGADASAVVAAHAATTAKMLYGCGLFLGKRAFDKIQTILPPVAFAVDDIPGGAEYVGGGGLFGKTIKFGLYAGSFGRLQQTDAVMKEYVDNGLDRKSTRLNS